jgi:hypothetical protein
MSTSSLTTIDWSSPTTIGVVIGVVVILAVGGYFWWAYSEKKWPFDQ